jgi:hypothetical protein
VRIWVNAGRVIVSPKCQQLIGSLTYGVWNENRNNFDRAPLYGHFDALAALMYLIRNVDVRTNPIPFDYNKPPENWFIIEENRPKQSKEKLSKAFGSK